MRETLFRVGLAAVGLGVLLACGAPGPGPGPDAGGLDSGTDGGQTDAGRFAPCPLVTEYTVPAIPAFGEELTGLSSAMAECAYFPAPANWNDLDAGTIEVFVKRYPAARQPAAGQLWLLEGGPGGSGATLEGLAFALGTAAQTLDVYVPDHRGTGRSEWTVCYGLGDRPTAAEARACSRSIWFREGLTLTGDARDIAMMIDATRTGAQKVFVLGGSYGAARAQRYLQVRPDQPTAVLLDSSVPAVGFDFAEWDVQFDQMFRKVLERCRTDSTCSAKLGPDPVAKATQAIAVAEAGTCAHGLGPIRAHFAATVGTGFFEHLLGPATVYRLLRCNSGDLAWFAAVKTNLRHSYSLFNWSNPTQFNVTFTEYWPGNLTLTAIRNRDRTLLASEGGAPYWATVEQGWLKVPPDQYHGAWPVPQVPILVLQGGLDPRTPFGAAMQAHYAGPNQYYVEFPDANHGIAFQTPMADLRSKHCGERIILSFLADPTRAPDTSCVSGVAKPSFSNPPPQWLAATGITDLWE